MPENEGQRTFKVEKETYYKATLPCGRKVELRNETFTVWTRQGEELNLGFPDVSALQAMREEWQKDRK